MLYNIRWEEAQKFANDQQKIISPLFAMGGKTEKLFALPKEIRKHFNKYLELKPELANYFEDYIDGMRDNVYETLEGLYNIKDYRDEDYDIPDSTGMDRDTATWIAYVEDRKIFLRKLDKQLSTLLFNKEFKELSPDEKKLVYMIYARYRNIHTVKKYKREILREIEEMKARKDDLVDIDWRY